MINLLPPDLKSSYRFARMNVSLRRWVLGCLIALIGLAGLATYGLVNLHQSTVQYNNQISSSKQLFQVEQFSSIQSQVQNISNSFKLVVKVLSQEVLFSELLKQVAIAIPTNANLTGLQISQLGGAIDISADATDYNTASQVQVNLADPANKIFTNADLISITCSSGSSGNTVNSQFPCTVEVRALFAANNPFLFINSKGSSL
jgi:hypothetical protein